MKRIFFTFLFILAVAGGLFFIKSCSTPPIKVFTIARDPTWYPLQLMGKEKNLQAFSDDLIYSIAVQENLHVEMVSEASSNLMLGLDNKYYDLVITSINPTPYLRDRYVFSDPIFLLGPVLIVPESSTVKSLEEMENKVIGIQSGSSLVYNVKNYPSLIIVPYDSIIFALEKLAQGHLDGVVVGAVPAYIYTSNFYKGKLRIATTPLTKEGLRLAALVGSEGEKFIEIFNRDLKEAKEKGIYDALLKKWDLFNPEKL